MSVPCRDRKPLQLQDNWWDSLGNTCSRWKELFLGWNWFCYRRTQKKDWGSEGKEWDQQLIPVSRSLELHGVELGLENTAWGLHSHVKIPFLCSCPQVKPCGNFQSPEQWQELQTRRLGHSKVTEAARLVDRQALEHDWNPLLGCS